MIIGLSPNFLPLPVFAINEQCLNVSEQCFQKYGYFNGEAYNECVRVMMYNCELDNKINIVVTTIVALPIVSGIIIGIILINKKIKNRQTTHNKEIHDSASNKNKITHSDEWKGI